MNMMDFEQHVVIKFLSKWNKPNVEIKNELLEVWGDAAYKKSTTKMDKKNSRSCSLVVQQYFTKKAVTAIPFFIKMKQAECWD